MTTRIPKLLLGATPVAAVLAGLAGRGLIGVDRPASTPAGDAAARPNWRDSVAAFAEAHPRLVLPQRLPDDVESVTALLVEGQPAVDVFRGSGPSVTVCSGDTVLCRQALSDDPVVRTGSARGVPYVVLVNPGKGLSGPPTLGDQATFWSEVALDTGRPDWLSAPDPL